MMWRQTLLLGLLACGSNERRPGYDECGPVPAGLNCVVWLCYQTLDENEAEFWVEWGQDGHQDCDATGDCTKALLNAANEECKGGGGGGGPDCRSDCCAVCSGDSVPCVSYCAGPGECTAEDPSGCACLEEEECK